MPKILAGIRRIADLEPIPAMALPVPNYGDAEVGIGNIAAGTLELVPPSQQPNAGTSDAADAGHDDAGDGAPAMPAVMSIQEPIQALIQVESEPTELVPLFAARLEPRPMTERAATVAEPFFTHQRAHDEMLRRSAATMPTLVTPAVAIHAVVPTQQAAMLYDQIEHADSDEAAPNDRRSPTEGQSYEDEFLTALAEQERTREDVQLQLHNQFLAHQQAHEDMLRRVAAMTPVAATAMDDSVASEDAGNTGNGGQLLIAPPATLERVTLREASAPLPLVQATLARPDPLHAGDPGQSVDWQPTGGMRRPIKRAPPLRPVMASPRRPVSGLKRTAATLIFASGAYFAIDGVTEQRVDAVRLTVAGLIDDHGGKVASMERSPEAIPQPAPAIAVPQAVLAMPKVDLPLSAQGVERLATSLTVAMLAKAKPEHPSVPTADKTDIPVERVAIVAAPPSPATLIDNTAANMPIRAIAAPVPIEIRTGILTASQNETITKLVHPPVLIHKRQQIAAAMRPGEGDTDATALRSPSRSLALNVEHGAAAMAAIVPPKPVLVRESLVRTALAALPRAHFSDAAITTSADPQRPDRTQRIAKRGVRSPSTRVAALDTTRGNSTMSDGGRRRVDTHAIVGIEASMKTALPVRQRMPAFAAKAWQRGEDLYARATLGRGQHAPERAFAGEGPHAAVVGQPDAYISVLGFRVRRVQPVWASQLFNQRQ